MIRQRVDPNDDTTRAGVHEPLSFCRGFHPSNLAVSAHDCRIPNGANGDSATAVSKRTFAFGKGFHPSGNYWTNIVPCSGNIDRTVESYWQALTSDDWRDVCGELKGGTT